jgi:hypothetical protein
MHFDRLITTSFVKLISFVALLALASMILPQSLSLAQLPAAVAHPSVLLRVSQTRR